jgi:hypothetical protein
MKIGIKADELPTTSCEGFNYWGVGKGCLVGSWGDSKGAAEVGSGIQGEPDAVSESTRDFFIMFLTCRIRKIEAACRPRCDGCKDN